MSISTTYMDFSFTANNEKREYTISLELRVLRAIKDFLFTVFTVPRLRKQIEPGKFEEISRNSPPSTMQCWF